MSRPHLPTLDGLRAISILLVLAAHLLPIGPKEWHLNTTVGVVGMCLFFSLSGFLVTGLLLERPDATGFLMRRAGRILPLAWLYMFVALLYDQASWGVWWKQYALVANLSVPGALTPSTAHLWSLCVEMQFYVLSALLVASLGARGLYLLPVLGLAVTAYRIQQGSYASSMTLLRADEVLAGCTLALLWQQPPDSLARRLFARLPLGLAILLFVVSCHEGLKTLSYFRPYFCLLVVGGCLAQPASEQARTLADPRLAYIAAVSYALYVLHPLLAGTWLGAGNEWNKYLKRPLLFAVLFGLAHLSTFHFERHWIRWARQAAQRRALVPPPATRPPTGPGPVA